MHHSKFYVKGTIVKLNKVPWKPIVIALIGELSAEFSLENNKVTLVAGEVDSEIIGPLIALVAQYFLPVQEIRRKRPR